MKKADVEQPRFDLSFGSAPWVREGVLLKAVLNSKAFWSATPLSIMALLHLDGLRVRVALHQDVDALAAIIYHAMPMDPQWDYRFPLRKKYPQDNYGHTCLMMKSMLEEQSVFINVVTFPAPGLREDEEIPVAVAVWEVKFNSDRDYSFAPTGMWSVSEHGSPCKAGCLLCTQAVQAADETRISSTQRHLTTT